MLKKTQVPPMNEAKSLSIFSDVREVVEMSKKKTSPGIGRCHRREVQGILKEKKFPPAAAASSPFRLDNLSS